MEEKREHHNAPPFRSHPASRPDREVHRAFPVYVADGDTYELLVEDHLDLHGFRSVRVRLADIDTWETFGVNRDPERGPPASQAAADLLELERAGRWEYTLDNPVLVELYLREFNRERQIGRVFLPSSGDVEFLEVDTLRWGGLEWISIGAILRTGGHEKAAI